MAKNILLLMMGGSGTRFGADIPKQFVEVNGKPVFSYIVEKYGRNPLIDAMVIVCHKNWLDFTRERVDALEPLFPFTVTAGGASRSESVKKGLQAAAQYASTEDVVLIHDDLLATGGSMRAAYDLVQKFHPKKVYINFIIELCIEGLEGRKVFDKDTEISTLMRIE